MRDAAVERVGEVDEAEAGVDEPDQRRAGARHVSVLSVDPAAEALGATSAFSDRSAGAVPAAAGASAAVRRLRLSRRVVAAVGCGRGWVKALMRRKCSAVSPRLNSGAMRRSRPG
ncbi:hypothetical protein GCM10023167_11800 [Brevibacterium pityocampae]|uniref:Uncharacterized protein n=1 Tax=Brevibacterium pityocampae TaxID=506594 RepID=A0ABP8JA62_9MICO